ncbi:type II secretion system inner membrane protein GspF [Halomonas sp. SSL-5]|uniref:type II secretion system inner membrane protein GspF n=1 Tax=Halomonas sp. SSL-5 TaxID=3065855 RepID=UPI002739890B|nr:type II secretion system inner membrane protein GspF [Halomonas sp. SSL-5]MDY7117018.1 type II secretion system inner membrane protein GspF [Halomonas sp. SSL-5]
MPTYRYLALKPDGSRLRSVLQADSERHARQLLRDRGLFPRRLTPVGQRPRRRRSTRLDNDTLAMLTRQLATLVEAGIAIGDALDALAQQTEEPKARSLLLDILRRVREGYALADSLAAHPSTFDDLYRSLVAAGERAGRLSGVLEQLADHLERVQQQRSRARTALIYPSVLIVVSILVVVGLMTHVVPRLAEQFEHSNLTLPTLTRLLISLSDLLQATAGWLAALLLVAGVLVQRLLRRPTIRRRWHAMLLCLPRLGELLLLLDTARLTRTLAILTGSGIPLLDALRVSRNTLGNRVLREAVDAIVADVSGGISLHRALARTGRFPPTLLHMVASGEASGRLERMLERIAISQETTFNRRIEAALGLFEPLLILIMGGVVLVIVLAILLPIMSLNGSLSP